MAKEHHSTLRIDAETAARVDRIRDRLAAVRPGEDVKRSGVFRGVIARGLDVMEAELDAPGVALLQRAASPSGPVEVDAGALAVDIIARSPAPSLPAPTPAPARPSSRKVILGAGGKGEGAK